MSDDDDDDVVVLYTYESAWGLHTKCPFCLHAETYLRLSGRPFSVERVQTTSASPTGELPALSSASFESDRTHDSVVAELASVSGGALESGKRLRGASTKATAAAFKAMAERCLIPASLYVTWVDSASYSAHTVPSYGAGLPFPANRFVPLAMSRDTIRRNARSLSGITEEEMLGLLKDCYATLALLLEDGRRYLITEGASDSPTSLDALVFAHLAFQLRSPMGEVLLRPLMSQYPRLIAYVDFIANRHFASEATPAKLIDEAKGRYTENDGRYTKSGKKGEKKGDEGEFDKKYRRHSMYWLGFSVLAMVAYAVSGEMSNIVAAIAEDDDDEDDDDGDFDDE